MNIKSLKQDINLDFQIYTANFLMWAVPTRITSKVRNPYQKVLSKLWGKLRAGWCRIQ